MKTVLIIGGGAAGLSAGIYAELNGYRAVICEKQHIAGGSLSFWKREGHHIDNCIHWLIGTNENTDMYKTWCELGVLGDADVHYKPYLYTSVTDKGSLSLSRDLEKFQSDMLALSPHDAREIRSFIKAVRTLEGYFGIAGEDHNEKFSGKKLIARIPNLLKYYNLSLEGLARRFRSPVLRDFFVSFMPADFGSLALIFTAANFCGDNAGLPLGGSAEVLKRLTERCLSLGGTIEYGKEAERVRTEGDRAVAVSFTDGTELSCDHIILTIDPSMIFGKLIDCPMPSELASQYKKLRRFSAVQCAFECDVPDLPFEGEQTIFIPGELRSVLPGHHVNLRYEGHEKSYSPEGKSLLQSMIYCDEETAVSYIKAKNDSKEKYEKLKSEAAETLQSLIVKNFPFLDGKMRAVDVWTPATYHRIVGTQMGSFMSFALPGRVIPKELKNDVPPFDNLMLAGQWLQAPGGLPIAVNSGKAAVMRIVEKDRLN
ncbi:MAG: NAD(P)/FAD-dependent oxidoreductase [Clostridia bacterium]|nr:NAD(P)/FAD-dependent oxidoreductase [Clostridia bacterium]